MSSSRRQQISILYLLHDVLHHTKFHGTALTSTSGFDQISEPYVLQLVALASAHDPMTYTQHFGKLNDLIAIWSEDDYYPAPFIATLCETVKSASGGAGLPTEKRGSLEGPGSAADAGPVESRKHAPYIMPPSHGDTSVPFYDLPAGNLMPCIVPNLTTPINPQIVEPLQFRTGPADEILVHAVKSLLQDADLIYGTKRPGNEIGISDIDELGQLVIRHGSLEEFAVKEGYYGWSEAFCGRMNLRSKRGKIVGSSRQHQNDNPDFYGGQRYSYSGSSRSRSRSPLRSRFPSHRRMAGLMRRHRNQSDSRSRSRSQPRHFSRNDTPVTDVRARLASSRSRSRSRSYSPPDVPISEDRPAGEEKHVLSAPPRNRTPHVVTPPPAFLQQGFLGPGQMPIPPPPPPNYNGPWPPRPPPPPALAMFAQTFQMNAQATQSTNHPSFGGPPPPAPAAQNSSISSAQALYGQASAPYTGQAYQGNMGNLTNFTSQPWQHQSRAPTKPRGGSWGH